MRAQGVGLIANYSGSERKSALVQTLDRARGHRGQRA